MQPTQLSLRGWRVNVVGEPNYHFRCVKCGAKYFYSCPERCSCGSAHFEEVTSDYSRFPPIVVSEVDTDDED
ncbi:MAG: hypothetical protein JW834_01630 [Candidatus Diapherotrites archaeon]|nr:hypothetical protein [Candidatus Diapherotrites archaeon]